MPKSSKPRKQYRPHGINARAHVVAMMGAAALHIDDRTVWALALDSAITSVARGKASQQEWSCIFAAAALLEDLVKAGKARDPDDIVRHAEDACIAITTRYRLGQRAVRAQELADLRALFAAWSEATEDMTQGEKFLAEQRIVRRMECGQMRVLTPIATHTPPPCA